MDKLFSFQIFRFGLSVVISILSSGNVFAQIESPFKLIEGTICLEASVNGKKAQTFILDSGASVTALTPSAAYQYDLWVYRDSTGYERTLVKSIEVGDAQVSKILLYVFDPPQARSLRTKNGVDYAGILGHSFLSCFSVKIDYQKCSVSFRKIGNEEEVPGTTKTSLRFVNNQTHAKGFINGQGPLDFLIDTGASEVMIVPSVARKLGIKGIPLPSQNVVYTNAKIEMDGAILENLPSLIQVPAQANTEGVNYEVIIGTRFLSKFVVTLDYPNKILGLIPAPNTSTKSRKKFRDSSTRKLIGNRDGLNQSF
jgi:hypothetical protein